MGIFTRPGSKFYWYTFNYKNKRYKGSTKKTNRRDAHEWAAQRRRQIIDESVGIVARETPPAFGKFAGSFREYARIHYGGRQSTLSFYEGKLDNLLRFEPLRNARLDYVDEALIHRYIASRNRAVSPATCNRELATLSVILHLAYERKLIVRIPTIRKLREAEGRTFVLSQSDEPKLLRACEQPLRALVLLLVDTGLRAGEALKLKWADVDLEPDGSLSRGQIHVRGGKSKNAKRDVPLTGRAENMLRQRAKQIQQKSEWVFPGRSLAKHLQVTSADHQFRRICDSLTGDGDEPLFPPEFVLHSLRHTCLTRLGDAGVGAFEIMKLAGHANIGTSQRYVHPGAEAARRAIACLDRANAAAKERGNAAGHPIPDPSLSERAA
jgi:integrase